LIRPRGHCGVINLPAVSSIISLGEGCTPLTKVKVGRHSFLAKLEFLNPTGSYKDRGVSVMMSHILSHQVRQVIDDSSGNAGASISAYAAHAGIQARIFVPAHASSYKKQQIQRFNATLVEVEGLRSATTTACWKEAQHTTYASHAWSPFFLAGQMTCAWEMWEQLGRRVPAAIVCVAGQGGLLIGLLQGFKALLKAKLIPHLPRLYAVQARACDPIVRAWEERKEFPQACVEQTTLAEGIRIAQPVRGRDILRAIYESAGAAIRVEEHEILAAQAMLAHQGLLVEATSAAAVAGLSQICQLTELAPDDIVIPLTGSGLKQAAVAELSMRS